MRLRAKIEKTKWPTTERYKQIQSMVRYDGFLEILDSNAALKRNVVGLSKGCRIHEFAVIGSDGYDFERDPDGKLIKFPHKAGVLIGVDVEIGSFTKVSRGTVEDTIIGDGVKIASLCEIGGGCTIGKGTRIGASTVIGKGSKLGSYCDVEMRVTILPDLVISRNVHIHAGSFVTEEAQQNTCIEGNPAKEVKACQK